MLISLPDQTVTLLQHKAPIQPTVVPKIAFPIFFGQHAEKIRTAGKFSSSGPAPPFWPHLEQLTLDRLAGIKKLTFHLRSYVRIFVEQNKSKRHRRPILCPSSKSVIKPLVVINLLPNDKRDLVVWFQSCTYVLVQSGSPLRAAAHICQVSRRPLRVN